MLFFAQRLELTVREAPAAPPTGWGALAGIPSIASVPPSAAATPVEIPAGAITLIPCGFAMSIPPGWEAQVRPRSGLAVKHGISLPNTPGTIDADYRGEVCVPLINLGRDAFTVEPGMRIAQMVVAPVARAVIEEVDDLDETTRGAGGFGSTGR